jgi:Phosphotransferase enzyme family
VAAYGQLRFQLPAGMIHGDAYRGNLLRDGQRVVLADWDAVSTGPREVDLIPTLQATRFGLPDEQRDAFVAAYGQDIRSWDGYHFCVTSGSCPLLPHSCAMATPTRRLGASLKLGCGRFGSTMIRSGRHSDGARWSVLAQVQASLRMQIGITRAAAIRRQGQLFGWFT